jgi:acetyl esterase/lipase
LYGRLDTVFSDRRRLVALMMLPASRSVVCYAATILRPVLLVCVVLGACDPTPATSAGSTSGSDAGSGSAITAPPPADATTISVDAAAPAAPPFGLLAADRAKHATLIVRPRKSSGQPPPVPPPSTHLDRVKYRAPLGEMWAYVSQDPKDGKQHPAVVWAGGGIAPGIGKRFFKRGPAFNDQSASQLRAAGIVVMFPSYRGDHDNPGTFEMFYGEVDDYLAAVDHMRKLDYVDPARIYFGGHSTGGTLVLLAAELTDQFRAAFVFGPVTGAKSYGEQIAPFDPAAPEAAHEWQLRAPLHYVRDIRRPMLVVEGAKSLNARGLPAYERAAAVARAPITVRSPELHDHFSVVASQLKHIARKIAADDGRGTFRW